MAELSRLTNASKYMYVQTRTEATLKFCNHIQHRRLSPFTLLRYAA